MLMRANAPINSLALITIVAEDLETGRELVLDYPEIDTDSPTESNFLSMLVAIVVDVV